MNLTKKIPGLFLAALVVMALAGCREITTTTRVFPDGSCERTIEIPDDSSPADSVFAGPFPMPVDSTWKVTEKIDSTQRTTHVDAGKKTEGNKKRTVIAVKSFRSVVDLNLLYQNKGKDSLRVYTDVRLDRRFRWFNTFSEYMETYKACTPFKRVSIKDYLSPEELSLYYLKEDTLKLDKKVEEWLARSYFEELFHAMLQSAESIPVPGLDASVLNGSKEALFTALMAEDEKKSNESFNAIQTMRFLEKFYRNPGVRKWSAAVEKALKAMEKKQEFLVGLDSDSYVNRVVMPGLILDTNASTVEGATVEWKLKSNRFYWEDYVMRAESRVVNKWAIWVTAALLLAVLAALAVSLIRRK
jgi:hypothetical protein